MQRQIQEITTFSQIYRQKLNKYKQMYYNESQFVKKQLPTVYQDEKMILKYKNRIINGQLTINNEDGIESFKFLQYLKTILQLKLVGFQNIDLFSLPDNIRELDIIEGNVYIHSIKYLNKFSYVGHGLVSFNQEIRNIENIFISGAKIGYIYDTRIQMPINDIRKYINVMQMVKELTKSITLTSVQIKDIYNFKECKQLEYLDLSHNEICDLKVFSNFSKLTHLNLSFNNIRNVYPIGNNFELLHLNISNNQISSISVLKTFTKLVHFDASNNKIQDVKALENNSNLEYLDVSNNPVKYICLNTFIKLQTVNLLNTEIYEFPEVIQQDLQSFQIQLQKQSSNILLLPQNIARIQQIQSRLQSLTINGYNLQLNQLQNKMNLFGLKSIDLSNSQLSDISGLHNFVELETINISKNSVTDISVIQCFPNLTKFVGCFNRIKDISVINACQKLEYLDLSHNCIVDIPQISLTLRHLNLNSNQVYNQTQLHNNLSFVSLLDNYICYYSNVLEYNQVAIQNVPDQQYIEHNQISQNLQQLLFAYESNNMQYFQHYQQYVITKQLNFNKYVHYSENLTQFDSKFKSATFKDLDNLYEFSNWNYYKQMNQFNKLEIVSDDYIQGVNLCESQNIDAIILKRCMNVRFNRVNYNITALVVKSCNLQSIYGIEQMQQLKFLNLSDNRLTDISSLQGLHNLEYLNLEDNQVADISPISELNKLVVLIMTYKKVNPTDERASLNFELMPTNLNVLVVKWYYLKSLQGIHKLDKLQNLNLSYNKLRDIKQLQCLVSLNNLNISNNDLVFIKPLCNLRQLQLLDVSENSIPQSQVEQVQKLLKNKIQQPDFEQFIEFDQEPNQLQEQKFITHSQQNYLQNSPYCSSESYLKKVIGVTQSYQNLIKIKIRRTCQKYKFIDQKQKIQQSLVVYCNLENHKYQLINNLMKVDQDTSQ
ncbi:Conserved_hypothetical protein [Hexamita inflata]|uniref:Chaoptin n=1 Tax=Hexamita inflata TaxID=28002 RepID=A0AA86R333_9EUKA|nr:Conserved hypothetical protein [Hexamita inflata]